jgi:hypothetical protein
MYGAKKKPFPWLRVAAAVLIIGGAGVLANKFILNGKKNEDLAVVTEKKKTEADSIKDSTVNPAAPANTNAETKAVTSGNISASTDVKTATENSKQEAENKTDATFADKESEKLKDGIDDVVISDKAKPASNLPAPVATEGVKNNGLYKVEEKKVLVNSDTKSKAITQPGSGADNDALALNKKVAGAPAKRATDEYYRNLQTKIFRGRITDASNTGLPFAKVYNPTDNNAGTYTDANGNFTLTYPDTSLSVQVRALGYENASVKLQTGLVSNKVIMQDDRSISQVVISNQKPNAALRSRDLNRNLIEPEPSDGWENYDTYIANNLEAPEELNLNERKKTAAVQVSFEVDKNGEPVNISVEKSLCKKCDEEAIRLIKEGPKWKRNANKHGRTTVTINF